MLSIFKMFRKKPSPKTLQGFFEAYQEWLNKGAKDRKPFYRCSGLCGNLHRYVDTKDLKTYVDLGSKLAEALGHRAFPFNTSARDYEQECRLNSAYQNPERIAFVKEQCENAKKLL